MDVTADLPVAVALRGQLGRDVTSFVEAELGWHVIDAGGPLVPVLTLAAEVLPGTATIVLTPAPVAPDVVRSALLAGAIDVVAWPDERERLLSARPRATSRTGGQPRAPVLTIAGSRGGVGTSTVALAVGATVAWSGRRALVVGDDGLLGLAGLPAWRGPGAAELAALGPAAGDEIGGVAIEVAGVPRLHALHGAQGVGDTSGWPFDMVVVDAGRAVDTADVVVAGADAALRRLPDAVPVVVVEHGPLDRAGVRGALGRAPAGWLPYSARVARAGSVGRVPSALPGSWVTAVRDVLGRTGC